MAAPMRDSALDGGHRAKVADPRTAAATNFEYDDNEWDIGIGDLIIDLDADIEKTNEKAGGPAGGQMAQAAGKAKMAVEHSATVQDKGLKMKIKRTKPGTKTSEAKHEIVKPGEQNGSEVGGDNKGKHPQGQTVTKRVSGGHRKDKAREKHCGEKALTKPTGPSLPEASVNSVSVNGVVRNSVSVNPPVVAAPQTAQQPRPVFPASHGPGPPPSAVPNTPGPPAIAQTPKLEPPRLTAATPGQGAASGSAEERSSSTSPPPPKRIKTTPSETKELVDVCVGTSVGTITEPDCLGPCEPGTSVTLEGIVWHETEGGVLVVNVTWRGKTYVGTLLDCTRHDWAPPRFCDSPTDDLEARTPKGRGKRGRTTNSTNSTGDLSNFTETRSSVHSKLRNGNAKGGRGGRGNTPASGSSGSNSTGSNSPTPFVPPKQESKKSKERDTTPTPVSKRNKTPLSAPSSPPASPVLLECPEPNCSKKYKHINGLKYHQSHAHGCPDDDDTKDATSFSENEESNTEAPSPSATPVKSPPEKTETPRKEELSQNAPVLSPSVNPCSQVPSDPLALPKTPNPESPSAAQPVPLTPRPLTPQSTELPAMAPSPVTAATTDGTKSVVKPGVLRFGPPNEEFPVGVFAGNKSVIPPTVIPVAGSVSSSASSSPVPAIRTSTVTMAPSLGQVSHAAPITVPNPQGQSHPPPSHMQPPVQGGSQHQPPLQQSQPLTQGSVPQQLPIKLPQFKVKSTASLMPEDKNKERERSSKLPAGYKKKSRKSPAGSPHPPSDPPFGTDSSGREDLQSPAYSDISDDAAPVLESEVGDKVKGSGEKKGENGSGNSPHGIPSYGIYGPFYGQPPYLVPSVPTDCKNKENTEKTEPKPGDKEIKKEPGRGDYPQKLIQHQPHYYPFGYVPGYPGGFMEPGYSVMVPDDKNKDVSKGDKSPGPTEMTKHGPPPIQVPNPAKIKPEPGVKDSKHANENHQIIKESIEMKSQMNPYIYSRQPQSNQSQQQMQDDLRRYLYQRGKETPVQAEQQKQNNTTATAPPTKHPPPNPSPKHKDSKPPEEKKEDKVKQEGQKPTMETQGPPPPPTSHTNQYAFIPSYMQSPHYGTLPFDPNHPMYRNINPMIVPGPYGGNPYLGIPRYHAPEDLSRSPSGPTKALDILQHHANSYYSSHKIHELQERALKSPTPTKSTPSRESPSALPPTRPPSGPPQPPPTSSAGNISGPSPPVKNQTADNKDSRSPPPQRHVHTHHHTHVGLTYPLLPAQYPPPYGAAVLASQQAAAVAASVMNPYPPK